MKLSASAAAAAIAIGFLVFHLAFLPASLEDLDSINFALGLRHYDIAHHQPHPPGYPVFITLGRLVRPIAGSEAHALSLLGIVAGAAGVLALFALFLQLERLAANRGVLVTAGREESIACAAALVAATCPLYWFTAARPLSDVVGLVAAVAVQAFTLGAGTPAAFAAAAFCGGLATGIRSQVAWLTIPTLILVAYRRDRDPESRTPRAPGSLIGRVATSWAWLWPFAVGCLVWAIPMIAASGGPGAYWRALFNQGAEDLTGVQMLWTTPTLRVAASAIYYAFIAPWALWSVATVLLVFAVLGAALMVRFWRPPFVTIVVTYLPYLLFDLLFQETFTTRYALPLTVPVAYFAVRGAAAFGVRPALVIAVAVSVLDAHIGGTSIAAYARQPAPAFRLLDDMARAEPSTAPVLVMDRREQLDLRRPIAWAGDRLPRFADRLPSPPQHEWLELARYLSGGGRDSVWFVADPLRTDIDLVQHDRPIEYRWGVPYPVLLGGVRPNEMDWYRIVRPMWFVGEGWALTPEAAGVSTADHVGLMTGAINGWVRPLFAAGGALLIGGRNFEPAIRPSLTIEIGRLYRRSMTVAPGPFVEVVRLPFGNLDANMAEYQRMTVTTEPPARVAIEQFDAEPADRVVFGYGAGWNEQEYNPATGTRWRWLSERGELLVAAPRRPVRLHIEGESPRRYFSKASRLTVRVGDRVAFDDALSDDFVLDITLPVELIQEPLTTVVFETDQVYVPAERSFRSRDRRHLGLRIFKCDLRGIDR